MSNEKILLPRDFYAMLDKHVVGQEHAKHVLGAAAYVHTSPTREKSPRVLIMGPSGTGKTALAKALAKEINAPFVFVNATEYSQTGYVGKDISNLANEINKAVIDFKSKGNKKVSDDSSENKKPNFDLPDLKFSNSNDHVDIFNTALEDEYAPLLNYRANFESIFRLFNFSKNELACIETKVPAKINRKKFTKILKDYATNHLKVFGEETCVEENTDKKYLAHKELIDAVKNNESLDELSEKYLKIFYTYFKFLLNNYSSFKNGDISTLHQKWFNSEMYYKMILNVVNACPINISLTKRVTMPQQLVTLYEEGKLETGFKKFIDFFKGLYLGHIEEKEPNALAMFSILVIYWANYFLKKNLFTFAIYLRSANIGVEMDITGGHIYEIIEDNKINVDEIFDNINSSFNKFLPSKENWFFDFHQLMGLNLPPTPLSLPTKPSEATVSKLKNSIKKHLNFYNENLQMDLIDDIFNSLFDLINYLIFSNKSFYFKPEDILKLPEIFWFFANPKEDEIKKELKRENFQLASIKTIAKHELTKKASILMRPSNDNEIKRRIIRAEWLYQKLIPFFEIMVPDYLEKRKAIIEYRKQRFSILSFFKLTNIKEGNKATKEDETKDSNVDAIVFIDEFDKIAIVDDKKDNVSSIGVQRDLLGVLDGTILKSEGNILKKIDDTPVDTSRILFICAGAFMYTSMDGIIDELKGRFTLITKTRHLNKEEYRQLIPKEIEFFNLNLNTSKINCSFVFTDEIINLILETTFELNKKENLGVRRLKSIFQMLAGEKAFLIDYDKTIVIDRSDIENVRDAILNTSSTKLNQIGFV